MKKLIILALLLLFVISETNCVAINVRANCISKLKISCQAPQKESNSKIIFRDNHNGTIFFMNQTWSIIKDMGEGNWMIAALHPIAYSTFSQKNDYNYYPTSSISAENTGYKDSLAKKIIDKWYDENIKNTDYEEVIAPVCLNNPTFWDMKQLGWKHHFEGQLSVKSWRVNVIGPSRYPTTVNYLYGSKQAFLMSGSDLAKKKGDWDPDYYEGELIRTAIDYRDRLYNNGVKTFWLRSPSTVNYGASGLYARHTRIEGFTVWQDLSVVPALVVHLQEADK
jgi:hypothetical protein